ncbi:MAG TPA: ROK family protein [Acidobacteriaceae bacterium]
MGTRSTRAEKSAAMPDSQHTLAVDIGGTNVSVAAFRGDQLLHVATSPTQREGGPRWMVGELERLVRSLPVQRFDACGIGFGGPVDYPTQKIVTSTHVPGWDAFDLVSEIEQRFSVAAVMDRDTMVGALGEGIYGAGAGVRPFFYMTLSTGIGGGLLTEHGLYRGVDSFACELGHHTVLPGGPLCLCGSHGCMERMCCGLWLERDYGRPAKELLEDPEFVRRYVVHLAQGLKNTIMLLNPARIVIGGGISHAGEALFGPLRAELAAQMPGWSRARVDIQPPALGGQSVLWGALALARQHASPHRSLATVPPEERTIKA